MKTKKWYMLLLFVGLFLLPNVVAHAEDIRENPYPDFIFNNYLAMYIIDIIIIAAAFFIIYFGIRKAQGELKRVFVYVFGGVFLMAFNYILDLYSMIIGDIALMIFLHNNIFWLFNTIGFLLVVFGVYRMGSLFEDISKENEVEVG